MILLVDVGNSRIKWAREDELEAGRVYATARTNGVSATLDTHWKGLMRPDRVVIASVAGTTVEREMGDWIAKHWQCEPECVRARASGYGVVNRYAQPELLGADRWAALIGARHSYTGAACVVDCGTALTFNAMTASGEFLGGAIMPGLTAARRCLAERTQAIGIEEGIDDNCIARKTSDAVAAGTAIGLAGAIERMIAEYSTALGIDMRTIMTGGELSALLPHIRAEAVAAPHLVLQGLSVIARAT